MNEIEFNELVWDYGCNGYLAVDSYNEEQKQTVALAWSDAMRKETEKEADEVIETYRADFNKAGNLA